MTSWLDTIPANERQRIRERYRLSESAYEKLRENVKGPEDLEREMIRNDALAQLKFGLETEPAMKSALRKQVEKDIAEKGMESLMHIEDLPVDLRREIENGKFEITVDAVGDSAHDQIVIVPEGNVRDAIPMKSSVTDSYLAALRVNI
ncbi:hypothetical protein FJZ28_02515 [Candidatus Peregrinibacteria bacterium]|nr:hypothetical protein [Candidatus Peregrinibacteria bacterium]